MTSGTIAGCDCLIRGRKLHHPPGMAEGIGMTDLPNWVYDLIIDLERWRDEHPALYAQYAGSDEYRKVEQCGCSPLDHVPDEVLARARVIREYLRSVTVVRNTRLGEGR